MLFHENAAGDPINLVVVWIGGTLFKSIIIDFFDHQNALLSIFLEWESQFVIWDFSCVKFFGTHTVFQVRSQGVLNGDFDFFLVRCLGADATYVIPATVGIKLGYLNLYPDRERLLRRKEIDLNDYRDKFELLRA